MRTTPTLMAITCVVLLAASFGAEARKERLEITACECDEVSAGVYDCTIDFDGVPAVGDDPGDYHAHVTTEQDGVMDGTTDPMSCKAQTDCVGIVFNGPGFTATCAGAPLPDPACTALLEDDPIYFFSIVAKVAADPEPGAHGKATRALKDNDPNCVINGL